MRLIKLVRDRIPEFLNGRHAEVHYRSIPDDDVVKELRRKLGEECAEYLVEPSLSELADILAVLEALADRDLDVNWTAVEHQAAAKGVERGGFFEGMGMYAR